MPSVNTNSMASVAVLIGDFGTSTTSESRNQISSAGDGRLPYSAPRTSIFVAISRQSSAPEHHNLTQVGTHVPAAGECHGLHDGRGTDEIKAARLPNLTHHVNVPRVRWESVGVASKPSTIMS